MIPDSGYGADVSAPAVRQIWDSIYGLEGHKAALPGSRLPALPQINKAGQIVSARAAAMARKRAARAHHGSAHHGTRRRHG
jgi:penicillin-binding protein 2